jgi:hypothetical protein
MPLVGAFVERPKRFLDAAGVEDALGALEFRTTDIYDLGSGELREHS